MNILSEDPHIRLSDAQIEVRTSDRRARTALRALLQSAIKEFDALWHNPNATPQQQLAVRGNRAAAAFEGHARTVQYLQGMGVEYDYAKFLPPLPYTIHEDGRVTIDAD